MLNVFSRKDDKLSKIEARENDIMNAIQAKMSKPMSEDDLFGNPLAEKIKNYCLKSTYRLKMKLITWCLNTLWCPTTAVNNQYKHINSMYFQTKWVHYQLPLQLYTKLHE